MRRVRRVVQRRWQRRGGSRGSDSKVQQTQPSVSNSRPHQQTNGAIAALYEFAPPEEGEDADNANQNGQVVEEELVEA